MENISFSKTLAVTGLAATLFVAGSAATMAQFNGRNFERPALTDEQKEQLREVAGDREAVQALLEEFGVKAPGKSGKNRGVMKTGENREFAGENRTQLTDEQKEALKAAHQSGDREQVKALLEGYGIEGKGKKGGHGKMNSEQHEARKAAVEAGDYDAFVELLPENHPEVSESDFEKIQEMHEAMEAGDKETAKAIREELGFQDERHEMRDEKKEERKAAIESGDYDAFVELLPEDHPEVSEADFEKIQEMHEAREAGDHETAKEIREELGLEMPHHKGKRGEKNGEDRPERGESEGRENEEGGERGNRPQLTDEQKEALKEAHQSGDREQVRELLEEYGIERGPRGGDRGNR